MAGSVEDGDIADSCRAAESPDMLRDGTCFTGTRLLLRIGIDEAGFAVVDMAHKGDDRGAVGRMLGRIRRLYLFFDGLYGDADARSFGGVYCDLTAELLSQEFGTVVSSSIRIIQSDDHSLQEQFGDKLGSF